MGSKGVEQMIYFTIIGGIVVANLVVGSVILMVQ
jgi:hypothetical protein